MRFKDIIRSALLCIGTCLYYNKRSKIFYYHDFFCENKYTNMATSMDLFKQHVKLIRANDFEIVPKITKPRGQIAIMLDDGFRGIWDNKQYFIENNIFPTIFLAENLIGKENYLSSSEVVEMNKLGFIFQSHTVSHQGLNTLAFDETLKELQDSKNHIEGIVDSTIDEICAPKGQFSNIVCEQALRTGYKVFYSSIPGVYDERITDFSFVQPRNLAQSLTPFQFKCALLGGYNIFRRRYMRRRYIKY